MFQYSFCSYSTQFPISINQLFFWFQYSFCSYSTIGTWRNFGERHCFNTASVLIQRNHHHNSFEDSKVSIQLLFLFNSHPRSFVPLFHLFQYSFCSYSTPIPAHSFPFFICFNTASVLIQQAALFPQNFIDQSFNTASVLIQLEKGCNLSVSLGFNTASVLIQQKCGMKFYKVDWFQYSFCSYSTFCLGVRRIFYKVSIQLLFLFNMEILSAVLPPLMFQYSFCSYSTRKLTALS